MNALRWHRNRRHGPPASQRGAVNDLWLLLGVVAAGAAFSVVLIVLFGSPSDPGPEPPAAEIAVHEAENRTDEIDADSAAAADPDAAGTVIRLPSDPAPDAPEIAEEADTEIPQQPENVGGMGDVEQRTTDLARAPEDVIEDCEKHFGKKLSDDMRLRALEGPVTCSFSVEFEGLINQWALMTVPRLPKDILDIIVVEPAADASFDLEINGGSIVDCDSGSWRWQAPEEPGIYCVRIVEKTRDEAMCLHAVVLHDWDGVSPAINGYKIGTYQDKPLNDNPRYNKPRGFIEVTEENEDTWVSPHFQLKQFVCKQQGNYPKYMLLEPRLLLKLEILIEKLEQGGIDTESLYILSGFRTPWYNKAIGNSTSYSRHLYGDAADLFVDVNRDGNMDDLDFDGRVDGDDARVIHKTIREITAEKEHLEGGLGFYDSVNYRNPFVHVDTRGTPARWYK